MKFIKSLLLLVLIVALFLFLLWQRSPIEPVAWQPGENTGLEGVFAPNQKLRNAELLKIYQGTGPEDVLLASDGWAYTGYADGAIIRFRPASPAVTAELFVRTGGRPLGLELDNLGNLIVADADKGLLSVSPEKEITVLVDSYEGARMRFVDDLDIGSDGTVWFSDASQRFGFRENLFNFFEASFTGRLFSYNPRTKKTVLHIADLFFANGVALGPDEEYVLVNETGMARIHRLWLKGEKRGQQDIFIDNLPGMPDNLSFNGRDKFWVALVNLRQPVLDDMAGKPALRKLLAGLPPAWFVEENHHGFIISLDLHGGVIDNLQADNAGIYQLTSVNEYGDRLYFGSLAMDAIARMPLPQE